MGSNSTLRSVLSLVLVLAMLFTMTPVSAYAEPLEPPAGVPTEIVETPVDTDEMPADADETPAGDEETPADTDETPTEVEETPAAVEETPADDDDETGNTTVSAFGAPVRTFGVGAYSVEVIPEDGRVTYATETATVNGITATGDEISYDDEAAAGKEIIATVSLDDTSDSEGIYIVGLEGVTGTTGSTAAAINTFEPAFATWAAVGANAAPNDEEFTFSFASPTDTNISTIGVTLAFAEKPEITLDSANSSAVTYGGTATIAATIGFSKATYAGTLDYQWYKGDETVGSANTATLSLTNVKTTDAGSYKLVATNSMTAYGIAVRAESDPVTLTVSDKEVDHATIGLISPVAGQKPKATLGYTAHGGQYKADIAWKNNDDSSFNGDKFAVNTVYKAVITLSATTGYTFNGVDANFFKVASAAATNSANSGVVNATFLQTGDLPYATTPTAAISYTLEQLTGFKTGVEYVITVNGSATNVSNEATTATIADTWFGETASIVGKATNALTKDSLPQEIVIPDRPDAPTGVVTASQATTDANGNPLNNGALKGVTSTIAWTVATNGVPGTWTTGSGDVTGLAAGTYLVREIADNSQKRFASETDEIVITVKLPTFVEATATIANTVAKLGFIADDATSSDETVATAEILADGTIAVTSVGHGEAVITVSKTTGAVAGYPVKVDVNVDVTYTGKLTLGTITPFTPYRVTDLDLDIPAPVAGQPIASVLSNDSVQYGMGTVEWFVKNDNGFEPFMGGEAAVDTIYAASVALTATKDVFAFATGAFTINGKPATSVATTASTATISHTFPATGKMLVEDKTINGIKAPALNETPQTTIASEANNDEYFGTIAWTYASAGAPNGIATLGDTDVFAAGTQYTAVIELLATNGYTFFATTGHSIGANAFSVTGAVAGGVRNPAAAQATPDELTVEADFPHTTAVTIDDTFIEIAVPKAYDKPQATFSNTQLFGTIAWTGALNTDNTFKLDTAYTATVTMKAKDGFKLAGVITNSFTIPGQLDGQIYRPTYVGNSSTFSYAYPKTEKQVPANARKIAGIKPVAHAMAPTYVTNNQFEGDITWWYSSTGNTNYIDQLEITTDDDGYSTTPFAANTVYKAEIQLRGKYPAFTVAGITSGFSVDGLAADKVTFNPANYILTAVFPASADNVVSDFILEEMPSPILGEVPSTQAFTSPNNQYTVTTITWAKLTGSSYTTLTDSEKVTSNTTYRAILTITPTPGYTLAGVAKNKFKAENDAKSTTNNAFPAGTTTGDVTVIFNPTSKDAFAGTQKITGLTKPIIDAKPSQNIAALNNTSVRQYSTVLWYETGNESAVLDSTDRFESGKKYTAEVDLRAHGVNFYNVIGEGKFLVDDATTAFTSEYPYREGTLKVSFQNNAALAFAIDYENEELTVYSDYQYRIMTNNKPLTVAQLKDGKDWKAAGAGIDLTPSLDKTNPNAPYVIYVRPVGDTTDGGNPIEIARQKSKAELSAPGAYVFNSKDTTITFNEPVYGATPGYIKYTKDKNYKTDFTTLTDSHTTPVIDLAAGNAKNTPIYVRILGEDKTRTFASHIGTITLPSANKVNAWDTGLALKDFIDFGGADSKPTSGNDKTGATWRLSDKALAYGDKFEFTIDPNANTANYDLIPVGEEISEFLYTGAAAVPIYIRRAASDIGTEGARSGKLTLPAIGAAPAAKTVKYDNPTMSIKGVKNTMEFHVSTSATTGNKWTTVEGTTIPVQEIWLDGGEATVYVRNKATETALASKSLAVIVKGSPALDFDQIEIDSLLKFDTAKGTLAYNKALPQAFTSAGYNAKSKIEVSVNGNAWVAAATAKDLRPYLTKDGEIFVRFIGNNNVTTSVPYPIIIGTDGTISDGRA